MIGKKTLSKIAKEDAFMSYDTQGRQVWEIKQISEKKFLKKWQQTLWKVEWKGFAKKYSTWEPRTSFSFDPDTLLQGNCEMRKDSNHLRMKTFRISAKAIQIRYQKHFLI